MGSFGSLLCDAKVLFGEGFSTNLVVVVAMVDGGQRTSGWIAAEQLYSN